MRGLKRVEWNLKQMFRSFKRSPVGFLQGFSLLVMTIMFLANIGLVPSFLAPIIGGILDFTFYTFDNGVRVTPLWIAMLVYAGTLMGLITSSK